MAGEKPDVLLVGAKKPVMMKGFEGKVTLHHWLDAADKAEPRSVTHLSTDRGPGPPRGRNPAAIALVDYYYYYYYYYYYCGNTIRRAVPPPGPGQ